MAYHGSILRSAKTCCDCKPFCFLLLSLMENRFTSGRRTSEWYDPRDKYRPGPNTKTRFFKKLEESRLDRQMGKKYGQS